MEANGLKTGQIINPRGYDEMAHINYGEGDGYVLVTHNNSTHYVIFSHDNDIHKEDEARFEMSVRYGENDAPAKYNRALELACYIATRR